MEEYIIIGKGVNARVLTIVSTEELEDMDKEVDQIANEELFILEMSMKE